MAIVHAADSLLDCHVHIIYTLGTTRNAVTHTQLHSHPISLLLSTSSNSCHTQTLRWSLPEPELVQF
jgi:hypothetical protein